MLVTVCTDIPTIESEATCTYAGTDAEGRITFVGGNHRRAGRYVSLCQRSSINPRSDSQFHGAHEAMQCAARPSTSFILRTEQSSFFCFRWTRVIDPVPRSPFPVPASSAQEERIPTRERNELFPQRAFSYFVC